MDPGEVLTTLTSEGVVRETNGNLLTLTSDFAAALHKNEHDLQTFDEEQFADEVGHLLGRGAGVRPLADGTVTAVAELRTLEAYVGSDRPLGERMELLLAADQVNRGVPRGDSVPNAFMPVHGDTLPILLSAYGKAIVYCWRDDCPECDLTQETFNDLYNRAPEDIVLIAVYGPDYVDILRDEYDVVGGPTTLFVVGGTVDARLHGAPHGEAVANEISILQEA